MAVIRIPENLHIITHNHLFGAWGEHFAFFLANWTYSQGMPVFLVHDVLLIPDEQLSEAGEGMALSLEGILLAINTALKSGSCLIEAHNHGGVMPRFSWTDRQGLREFPAYVHSSLPNRPYAATVWGDTTIYGEYFLPDGKKGQINSVTVTGNRLQQIVSKDDDREAAEVTFARQLDWFTQKGQQQLGRLRIGIVGCGGTGSHIIQNLAYLGARSFVLVDDDVVEDTNLNRLVTAFPKDMGKPKTTTGERLIKAVSSRANVNILAKPLRSPEVVDILKAVDIIFGCVDNDGARLILNELAVAYNIPYIDIASGIVAENDTVEQAGGRVAIVLPDGPCLQCMGEISTVEARYFLSSTEDQRWQIARGYITGLDTPNPSVVSLNALISAVALNEFAVLLSGLRPVNLYSEYDLLGVGRSVKGQWLTPRSVKQNSDCLTCSYEGRGDAIALERYTQSPE